jgi:3-oxoacyl-[acyl-carrier-protein] synthase II
VNKRVVVTGAAVISPAGAGIEEFQKTLYSGKSAVEASTRFPGAVTSEFHELNVGPWLGAKGIRMLDRAARLLCVSSHMALTSTGVVSEIGEAGDPDIGLVCGTMFGGVHSIASFDWSGLTEGVHLVNPMEFPNTVINSPAGQAAIKYKLRGVNSTICCGLSSGLQAIHYAAEFLRFGRARVLLAGGVEELCEESLGGFVKTGISSPTGAARPFGTDRDGTSPGEGSALWVLETEEGAAARGRTPLLEICGCGIAQDAYSIQGYNVRGEGAADAIAQALEFSGIQPSHIGVIVASANGSRTGDEMEARALRQVFGDCLNDIPVTAPKAAVGECMGVSGALLALVGGIALREQCAPPTAGFAATQSGLRLSAEPQPFKGEYALVNAFGCDGNHASLVVRLWNR